MPSEKPQHARPWTRPSDLYRSLACPASCALPKEKGADKPGPAAKWGKEIHAWKEGEPATPRVQRWAHEAGHSLLTLEEFWPGGGVHEPLYIFRADDVPTRMLGITKESRAEVYATLGPNDMWGFVDYETCTPFQHVDELKTGRLHPGNPLEHPQSLVYARGHWKVFGGPGTIVSTTHWPRYPKGKRPDRWTEWASGKYLDEWHHDVLVPARRLAQGRLAHTQAVPGAWCRYCRCPSCEHWGAANNSGAGSTAVNDNGPDGVRHLAGHNDHATSEEGAPPL